MKKTLRNSCYLIKYNNKYVCILGNIIAFYSTSDLERVCFFSDMKQYTHGEFINETIFVAKNIFGMYKIYDIEQGVCIRTIQFEGIDNKGGQDSDFILSPDKRYIYDVLNCKLYPQMRFYKIDVATGEATFFQIADHNRLMRHLSYYEKNNSIRLVYWLNNIIEIDLTSMSMKIIYKDNPSLVKDALMFYENRYVLNKNLEIIDIEAKAILRKVNCMLPSPLEMHIQSAFLHDNKKYLVMIFGKKFMIIDFITGQVLFEFADNYCSAACFVGDYLLLGTWEKVIVIDNPLLKMEKD